MQPIIETPVNTPALGSHYRPEIDGLRALAVLAVVLYHSRVPGFGGGFVGVDVFFAISGYVVIGGLNREQLRTGTVDWTSFLIRRIRRLLPLLLLTVLLSLALGYWLLPPFGEFQNLCQSAIAALGLSANVFFWRFAGSYFNPYLEQLPLLHLWSLSVEEQFYLIVPAAFLLARWQRTNNLAKVVMLLGAASLALCIWGSAQHPMASFYLPITRAWEFAAGALAALSELKQRPRRSMNLVLLLGIVLSFLLLDPDLPLQVLLAGLPAVLTALLLHGLSSQPANDLALRLLQHSALCWIGQRAYAWYLLHWPALAFYRHYWLEDVSPWELPLVSAAALPLAAIAHRYIELPLRNTQWRFIAPRHRLLLLALLTTTSVATTAFVLGVQASQRQAQPEWQFWQVSEDWLVAASHCLRDGALGDDQATVCESPPRTQGAETLFLWGDSHAYHLRPSLNEVSARQDIPLRTWAMAGCPPLTSRTSVVDLKSDGQMACSRFSRRAIADIVNTSERHGTIAILAARWEPYLAVDAISIAERYHFKNNFDQIDRAEERRKFTNSLLATVKTLDDRHIQIILVASVPEQLVSIPSCVIRFTSAHCRTARALVEQYSASTMQMLKTVVAQHPHVQVVDPINTFCDTEFCNPGPAKELWYMDDDHLSAAGSRRLMPLLSEAVAEARWRLEQAANNPQKR
ncbi:MAG: acyltransferase family protein [Pseudomonadota bacterium]